MHMSPLNALKTIVKIEQPIHFEELCRRMAPLYGRQKQLQSFDMKLIHYLHL